MNSLEKARRSINKIDRNFAKLFEKRMKAVKEVLEYKKENALPVFDGAREEEILKRNAENKKSRLHEIRKARGFTQQQLSDASGVSLRMIQLYEQRQNDISKAQVSVVLRLAWVLGCEVEDLIE